MEEESEAEAAAEGGGEGKRAFIFLAALFHSGYPRMRHVARALKAPPRSRSLIVSNYTHRHTHTYARARTHTHTHTRKVFSSVLLYVLMYIPPGLLHDT